MGPLVRDLVLLPYMIRRCGGKGDGSVGEPDRVDANHPETSDGKHDWKWSASRVSSWWGYYWGDGQWVANRAGVNDTMATRDEQTVANLNNYFHRICW